ncbi:MAG: hypothetical protein ACJATI_004729 [Halioglobus sp.]|jgi:hypothetical protein
MLDNIIKVLQWPLINATVYRNVEIVLFPRPLYLIKDFRKNQYLIIPKLEGIGEKTWIKHDEVTIIEGLKQRFVLNLFDHLSNRLNSGSQKRVL